ncbi:MAG: hypothetical protein GY754_26520 [bacterium]|nr:hypothetical protein [bacterium]
MLFVLELQGLMVKALLPLISEYKAANPNYEKWILEEFESNEKWKNITETLLTSAGIIGFAIAEYFSGGLATFAGVAGLSALAGLAVRSQKRAGFLKSASYVGFTPREKAAVAKFKAWLDTASAAMAAASAMTSSLRYARSLLINIKADRIAKLKTMLDSIPDSFMNNMRGGLTKRVSVYIKQKYGDDFSKAIGKKAINPYPDEALREAILKKHLYSQKSITETTLKKYKSEIIDTAFKRMRKYANTNVKFMKAARKLRKKYNLVVGRGNVGMARIELDGHIVAKRVKAFSKWDDGRYGRKTW